MSVSFKIKWDEGPLSVGSGKGSAEIEYFAYSDDPDVDDRETVLSQLLTAAPTSFVGLVADEYQVEARVTDNADLAIWDCRVSYTNSTKKQPFPLSYEVGQATPRPQRFSIRMGATQTVNRTQSLKLDTVSSLPKFALENAANADLDLYMGFEFAKDDGIYNWTLGGVPVPMASVELVLETVYAASEIQAGQLITASLNAGKNVVNQNDYFGFPAGSLRFINFDSSQRATDEEDPSNNQSLWDVSFTMNYSPEEEAQKPDGSGTITKKGQYYADLLYAPLKVQLGGNVFITLPRHVRTAIHQIYPEVDFHSIFNTTP